MKVWLTERYAKDAPTPATLKMHGEQKWVHLANGIALFGLQEGERYHRRYADAVIAARANRDAWLRELIAQAAEVAALPPIGGSDV